MSNLITQTSGLSTTFGTTGNNLDEIPYVAGGNGTFLFAGTFEDTFDFAGSFSLPPDGSVAIPEFATDFDAPAEEAAGAAILADGTQVTGYIDGASGFGFAALFDGFNDTLINLQASFPDFEEMFLIELAALADGGFAALLYWKDSSDLQITLRYFDASGAVEQTIDVDAELSSDFSYVEHLQLSAGRDGGVAVLIDWANGPGDQFATAIRYNADGNIVGSAHDVANDIDDDDYYEGGDVAVLRDGRTVVVYEGGEDLGFDASQILMRIMSADGTAIGAPVRVSTTTPDGDYNEYPNVVATRDGGFIVGWNHDDDEGTDVLLRRYDADGVPMGDPETVHSATGDDSPSDVDLALDGDGNLIVGFKTNSDGGYLTFAVEPVPSIYADDLVGTPGDDSVQLMRGDDRYLGLAGDDLIYGEQGDDIIRGGGGNDTIRGGTGEDRLLGGGGDDKIVGGSGDDVLRGKSGDDVIKGRTGDDDIKGNRGADTVYGNRGDDMIEGNKGADKLYGSKGRDEVKGGQGDDKLWGNGGRDDLRGGKGDDRLEGGNDRDILTGGAGADSFVFGSRDGRDIITDFDTSEDMIRFKNSVSYRVDQRGDDTVITYNGDQTITLRDVSGFTTDMIDLA